MIPSNSAHEDIRTTREKLLEKRIELLQKRVQELENETYVNPSTIKVNGRGKPKENRPSVLVLPVTYTPEQERSPILEIVSYSPVNDSNNHLLLVEQSNTRVYETIV
jgi:hypothetical protein